MRVVEPRKFEHTKKIKKRSIPKLLSAVVLLVGVSWGVFYVMQLGKNEVATEVLTGVPDIVEPDLSEPEETVEEPAPEPEPVVESTSPILRIFADNDFKIFYDQLLQPDLLPVENPPDISGNTIADARIRKIAEDRGYRLRSSPSVALSSVEGYPVHASLVSPWKKLKADAAAQGLNMSIVSAYRAVDHQRTLFLSRLAATGATIQQVADGLADDKVNSVLVTSSIPGYSKHHTGYTVDILCAGWAFENFKNSPCHTWIVANNYEAAKVNGFIPSYPENADLQGPDPEAWEYVWVGVDLLYE